MIHAVRTSSMGILSRVLFEPDRNPGTGWSMARYMVTVSMASAVVDEYRESNSMSMYSMSLSFNAKAECGEDLILSDLSYLISISPTRELPRYNGCEVTIKSLH